MAMNKEVRPIDSERALHDAMHVVCKYINVYELSKVAIVCKSWRYASLQEREKRYYIQHLRLHYKFGNMVNRLNVIPFATLFFYDLSLEYALSAPNKPKLAWMRSIPKNFEKRLLKDVKKQLPSDATVLLVDMYLTTEDIYDTKEQKNLELSGNCDILGLFFPNVKQKVHIHVACVDHFLALRLLDENFTFSNYPIPAADSFAERLGFYDCKYPKSTILLLSCYTTQFHWPILRDLQERARNSGQEIEFIGIFGLTLQHGGSNGRNELPAAVALRISGPGVESWSTFIYYRAQCDEIESKLHKLKEQVKRKQHYIGLLYSMNCTEPGCSHVEHPSGDSREMMYNLNRIFPNIRFMGFFCNRSSVVYSLASDEQVRRDLPNEKSKTDEFLLNLPRYTSVMIISYD